MKTSLLATINIELRSLLTKVCLIICILGHTGIISAQCDCPTTSGTTYTENDFTDILNGTISMATDDVLCISNWPPSNAGFTTGTAPGQNAGTYGGVPSISLGNPGYTFPAGSYFHVKESAGRIAFFGAWAGDPGATFQICENAQVYVQGTLGVCSSVINAEDVAGTGTSGYIPVLINGAFDINSAFGCNGTFAGFGSPLLTEVGSGGSTLSAENTCPASTVDLDALHTGTVPSGTSLVWSTDMDGSDGLTSVETDGTTVGTAGDYYAYYWEDKVPLTTHDANDCYSPGAGPVTVTINACSSPCTDPDLYADNCDFDGDGIDNIDDLDDDNDGILDTEECTPGYSAGDPPILDLVVLLDGSGSIGRADFPTYISALDASISDPNIVPQDGRVRLTLIQFSTGVIVEISPTIVDATSITSISSTIQNINKIGASTETNLAIDEAVTQLTGLSPTSDNQVILLITDGNPDDQALAVTASNNAASTGVDVLNAINIGSGATLSNIEAVVFPQPSGGSNGYVITSADFSTAFGQAISGMVSPLTVSGGGDCDPDNDNIDNQFDLDSDGDGCSDAFEAGVITTEVADITVAPFDGSNVGANGFENSIESGGDVAGATYNGTYTYADATDDQVNNCPQPCTDTDKYADNCDFDGDGIDNIDDIDDDNDGVLDELESIVVVEDFEDPPGSNATGYDNFISAFPNGTSQLYNVVGGAGYFEDPVTLTGQLPASQGSSFSGLHSDGFGTQEMIGFQMNSNELFENGEDYTVYFEAYQLNLPNVSSNKFQHPGYFYFFGVQQGVSDPSLTVSDNANDLITLQGVDLLGTSGLIDNDNNWETYQFSFTASATYDRVIIVPTNVFEATGSTAPESDRGAFLGIDNIRYRVADLDDDNDGIANQFDLDSDGDGCSDAFEAGVITIEVADITVAPFDGSNVGANGFENSIESGGDVAGATYNGTYTYAQATDMVSACPQPCTDPDLYADNCDFDGDGVDNIDDLDDDNDGVLDIDELVCNNSSSSLSIAMDYAAGTEAINAAPDGWSTFGNGGTPDIDDGDDVSALDAIVVNSTQGFTSTITSLFPGSSTSDTWATGYSQGEDFGDYNGYPYMEAWTRNIAGLTIGTSYEIEFQGAILDIADNNFQQSNGVFLLYLDISGSESSMPVEEDKSQVLTRGATAETISMSFTATSTSHNLVLGHHPANSDGSLTNTSLIVNAAILNGSFSMSEACSFADEDNDGIENRFDLDSDNDGCSDAFEAGVITTEVTDITVAPFDGSNVGANGFENSIESGGDVAGATYNGTYTYADATDDQVNNCPACEAGTTAPTLSAIPDNCPNTVVDLTGVTATNTPAVTNPIVLEWHTAASPTDATTMIADVSMMAAGTYHAIFHDTSFDCYSPSTPVTIVIEECCLAPTTPPNIVLPSGSN